MAVNLSWWLVTVVAVAVNSATAKVIESNWEVEYKFWWPDCKEGIVMAINGQFPGPTINAVTGDTVIIHVINKLSTEGVVIHWHGIRQRGTPWADGATGVTQCAINPGETFTYNFTTDKAGTHFYHGHYGMQRSAGLYGMLIVKSPQEKLRYDGEFSLLLSDWWHQSIHAQELALSSSPMRWIGEPQSLLINGRGQFNCSLAAYFSKGDNKKRQCTFKERDECAPETLRVKPNSVYRLRIASTTALASLNLAVEGHKLEVVEADGNYVAPFTVDDIDIYSGETYSVLLKTHSSPSQKHWISVGVRGRKPNTTQALTLLNYVNAPDTDRPINPPPVTPRWDDYDRSKSFSKKIFAAKEYPPPPEKSDDQLILLNTQNLIGNYTKWAINNVSLSVPATPYLGSIRYGLKSAYDLNSPEKSFARSYDVTKPPANPNTTKGNGIYSFPLGIVVDVILQNANALKGRISEIHPWHIHGHDFWVLGYGDGKFRPGVDEETYNLKNPPLRNTVVLYPFGWTALRFVTDNPGVWFFHCHIEPHLHMGMGVVFAEGVNRIAKMDIPDEALGCGLTGKWLMNRRRH